MAIDKISGTAWASISKLGGISTSAIANVLGQTAPTGSVAPTISSYTYIEPISTTDGGWTINHQSPSAGQLILLLGMGGNDVYPNSATVTNMTATGFTKHYDFGPYDTTAGTGTNAGTIVVFTRIATGSEGTSSIAMDQDYSNYTIFWYILIDDANSTTPLNPIGSIDFGMAALPPTVTSSSITTTKNNSLVFLMFGVGYGGLYDPFTLSGTGWPTTPTDDDDQPPNISGSGVSAGWTSKAMPTAGATNDVTVTGSSGAAAVPIKALQFAIEP